MPHSELIYPVAANSGTVVIIPAPNLVYGSTSNPPFNWRTDRNPGAGCTWAQDGLDGRLFVDGQLIQHIEPPGYGSNGTDPGSWNAFPNAPGWPSSLPSGGRLENYANSVDPSMTNTSGTGYRLPFTPAPGVTHTWWVQYHSENGREGGTVRADNWTLGRFMIQGVNSPSLICQAPSAGNTGDIHDICDRSVSPPATPGGPAYGYGGGRDALGNVLRYRLSARDGGPADARQLFSTHRFDVRDDTTGASTSYFGPNNGPNAPYSLDGRAFLTSGHRYTWTSVTVDNASPPLGNPNSPPAPNGPWNFLYDISNPLVNIVGINGCFDTTTPGLTLPNPINILTNDPPVGGEASNIRSVTAQAFNDSAGGAPVPGSNQDLMGSGSCSWSGAPGVGNGSCNYNSSWAIPNGSIYRIVVASTDNAGNIGTNTARFTNKVLCIGPWLQTTSGDVHSNDKVNTPGGPL